MVNIFGVTPANESLIYQGTFAGLPDGLTEEEKSDIQSKALKVLDEEVRKG